MSKVREEGEDLGLERAGECGRWVDVSGFLREELLVCAETARCESAHCSSSLITALLEDKARHAQCVALEPSHKFTHGNVMNTSASLSKGCVSFEEILVPPTLSKRGGLK